MVARRRLSIAQRRARLVHRHRLTPDERVDDPVAITRSLVGLHSSDPATVYLSVAARMVEPSIEALQRSLHDDRSLVRHHAMRRTLWVLPPDTARFAHSAATTRYVDTEEARLVGLLAQNDVVADAGSWLTAACEAASSAVAEHHPITTREVGRRLPDLAVPLDLAPGKRYSTTQSALSRVLLLLGFRGEITRADPIGGWINSQYRWEPMSERMPEGIHGVEPDVAAAALVDRYLHAFGPATDADIRWWTGLPAKITNAALETCGAVEVELDGGATGWVAADDVDPVGAGPAVALLPGLDPTTMGWKERDWYLDPDQGSVLFDANGNGGPTIWVDGHVVGGWGQRADGEIAWRLLTEVGRQEMAAIDQEAERLATTVGTARFKVRFPSPISKSLLA